MGPGRPGRARIQPLVCRVDGCDKPPKAKGLCNQHYQLARKEIKREWWRVRGNPNRNQRRHEHPDELRAASRIWNRIRRGKIAASPLVEAINRRIIYERDNGRCHICGKKVDPTNFHLDHLVPVSLGGEHSYRNLALSHPQCNLRRRDSGPAQLRMLL